MPNGHLYHSPVGLYPFQAEAVALCYLHGTRICVVDTGLGKTHMAMALAGELYEANEIDLVIHVARLNKIAKSEFPTDWATFTSLNVLVYHGSGRQKRLEKNGTPDVLLTTYDTGRNELMKRVKRNSSRSGKGGKADGALMDTLGLRNKRVLWLFDEITRLRTRTSELYQAYDYVLNVALRRGEHRQRVVAFTATAMPKDYEQPFNIARLVEPTSMPSVGEFERRFTYGRERDHGGYIYRGGTEAAFGALFQHVQYRKRYSDPDVVDQYPKLVERKITVEMDSGHRALYSAVGELYGSDRSVLTTRQVDQLSGLQRLVAGHPAALLRAQGTLAKAVVENLGEDALRALVSSKSRRLIEELDVIVNGQGAQALIFTYYAETVLPELAADLRAAGFRIATYLSSQPPTVNEAAKQAFKAGEVKILLSSDAGSEGLNLPEAHYIIEYESARTFETRTQRFGRGTRITSGGDASVYGLTMVLDQTVEVGTFETMLHRNRLQDILYGDTGAVGHVGADTRRQLLKGS